MLPKWGIWEKCEIFFWEKCKSAFADHSRKNKSLFCCIPLLRRLRDLSVTPMGTLYIEDGLIGSMVWLCFGSVFQILIQEEGVFLDLKGKYTI